MFTEIRAAKAMLSTGHYDKPGNELLAFMHIFHPDHELIGSDILRKTMQEMNREAKR